MRGNHHGGIMKLAWAYHIYDDKSACFLTGQIGKRPLVCFSANPSMATPARLDNALRCVRNNFLMHGYDSWLVFNVYPQRVADPNKLHQELDPKLHALNLFHIKHALGSYRDLTIWAAWGSLILKRPYLKQCLHDIVHVLGDHSINWVHKGNLVSNKHPHRPLMQEKDLPFKPFNINKYLKFLD